MPFLDAFLPRSENAIKHFASDVSHQADQVLITRNSRKFLFGFVQNGQRLAAVRHHLVERARNRTVPQFHVGIPPLHAHLRQRVDAGRKLTHFEGFC
jgi:hypothetical protein